MHLALSVAVAFAMPLQPGIVLPQLTGDYLTGEQASLPADCRHRIALLALGFTYDSRFPVEEWARQFRQAFGNNPRVTFYEIPMISGVARLGRFFIDRGMRKGTPPDLHRNVVTVYGDTSEWKRRVGFSEPDHAYLILIDGRGRVRWRHNGTFDPAAFALLVEEVRRLLEQPAAELPLQQ